MTSTSQAQIDSDRLPQAGHDSVTGWRPTRVCWRTDARPPGGVTLAPAGGERQGQGSFFHETSMPTTAPSIQPDDGSILTPDITPERAGARARADRRRSPNVGKLASRWASTPRRAHVALVGLFVLAVFYTLYLAQAFLLPIVLAVLLDFLLSPLVRALKKRRIPEPVGAGARDPRPARRRWARAAGIWPSRPREWIGEAPAEHRRGAAEAADACAGRWSR